MPAFEIRRLKADNAATAIETLDALLPADWRDGPLPPFARMREVLSDAGVVLIAAYADAKAAGYVSGNVMPAIHRDGATVMLDDLYVAEPFRGRGLGRKLVDAFRAEARRQTDGPTSMWAGTGVDNAACRRAFEAAGGEAEDETYQQYRWRKI